MKTLAKIFLLGFIFTQTVNVFSCEPSHSKMTAGLTLNFNYEKGKTKVLGIENEGTTRMKFTGCHNDHDKFFLVRAGMAATRKSNNSIMTMFQNSNIPEQRTCIVENQNGQEFQSIQDENKLERNLKTFHKCVRIHITDTSGKGIKFEKHQNNCNMYRKSKNVAIMRPVGSCFFSVAKDSKFEVQIVPQDKCSDRKYLVKRDLSPTQIKAKVLTYLYPENNLGGTFKPTKTYPPRYITLDLNAGKDILKVRGRTTSDGSYFQQPEQFVFPDIDFSRLAIKTFNSGKTLFMVDLLVNTYTKKVCVEGLCTSAGNYDIPIAPKMTFYRIKSNGKKRGILSAHIGGRVENQWQGILKGKALTKKIGFKVGEEYRIELKFSDPTYDFKSLKKQYLKKIDTSRSFRFDGVVGVDSLKPLRPLSGIGTIGEIPSLGRISRDGIPQEMFDALDFIEESMMDRFFPPKYSSVCDKGFVNCRKSTRKEHLILGVNFKVLEIKGNRLKLGEYKFDRVSPLGNEFTQIQRDDFAKIKCN